MFKDTFTQNGFWTGLKDENGDPIKNPSGDDIWSAFERWKKGKFKTEEPAKKAEDDAELTREDAFAKVKSENPDKSDAEINKWLDDNGY